MAEPIPAASKPTHNRHVPEETTLYQLVQDNWLSFKEQVVNDTGYPLPDFVIKEFEEYLRCEILVHGFMRVKCTSCSFEHLVAFSCKCRGFCPSCGARRMSETAAHFTANEKYSPVGDQLPNPNQALPCRKTKSHGACP